MTAHSPHPWAWSNAYHADVNLVDRDGRVVVSCYWNLSGDRKKADARLIQAAPDLLVAAKSARRALAYAAQSDAALAAVYNELDAAIARAGGTP